MLIEKCICKWLKLHKYRNTSKTNKFCCIFTEWAEFIANWVAVEGKMCVRARVNEWGTTIYIRDGKCVCASVSECVCVRMWKGGSLWKKRREGGMSETNIKSGTHVMHIKVLQKFVPLKTSNNKFRFPTLFQCVRTLCSISFCRWCVIFKPNQIVCDTHTLHHRHRILHEI